MSKLDGRVGGSTLLSSKRGNARSQGSSTHYGMNPGAVPSFAMQNLTDDMSSSATLATKWPVSFAGFAITGGVATVDVSSSYFSGLVSSPIWCLNESYAHAKVVAAAANGGSFLGCEMVVIDSDVGDSSTNVEFFIDTAGNTISFNNNINFDDPGRVTITYDSTAHAWLRLRVSSGILYWDTSANGTSWTNRRNITAPGWLGKVNQYLAFWGSRTDGTDNTFSVDNVNL
jgi:hypothetical protein